MALRWRLAEEGARRADRAPRPDVQARERRSREARADRRPGSGSTARHGPAGKATAPDRVACNRGWCGYRHRTPTREKWRPAPLPHPRQSQARQPGQCKLAEKERNVNAHWPSISWIKFPVNANFIAMEPGGTGRDRSPVAGIHRPVNLSPPAAVDGAKPLKMDFHGPGNRQAGATAIRHIALAGGIAYSFFLPRPHAEQ